MEDLVQRDIFNARSWDHYNFLRGQHDAAKRFRPELIRAEIDEMKKAFEEQHDTK